MLSAPVIAQWQWQTTGGWVMEKFRQKIRKYTLQPDLLHFRLSVKGWSLQHYYAEVFLQNGFREGYSDLHSFLPHRVVTFKIQSWAINSILLSLKDFFNNNIPVPKYFTWTDSYDKVGVLLIWLCSGFHWKFAFVQVFACTGLLVWGDFGLFYLYIINNRVIDNIFFFKHGMSCLSG